MQQGFQQEQEARSADTLNGGCVSQLQSVHRAALQLVQRCSWCSPAATDCAIAGLR
jgi:hypothetical protein